VNPLLVVLCSPSGGGKTTIARELLARRQDVGFSVSATTRPPRENERQGVDYHFLTREEFLRRRDRGEFLEWAEYLGHLYGTLQSEVDRLLAGGRHVILDIEIEGAGQVRARRGDVVAIFVLPPSVGELVDRLQGRASERPRELAQRLARAAREVQEAERFDYVVLNDDREQAVASVSGIIDAAAHRAVHQPQLAETMERLRRALDAKAQQLAP
jgi:guanylate kinase